MKLIRNWYFHNAVAHPLLALLSLIGLPELGCRIHDMTTPLYKSKSQTQGDE
jgi:hypothetical protein